MPVSRPESCSDGEVTDTVLRDALDPSPTRIGGCADGVGLDELPWHRDLGHLEGNVAAMAQNPGANLDQLLSGARYCSKWYIDDSDGPLLFGLGMFMDNTCSSTPSGSW